MMWRPVAIICFIASVWSLVIMNGEGGEEAPWRFALLAIAFGLISAGAWTKHLRRDGE